jgi:heat shock protein HtpX
MTSAKYLNYQQLWQSSWKMWLWLVAATAVPVFIVMYLAEARPCQYCMPFSTFGLVLVALAVAAPLALGGLLVGFVLNINAKQVVGNAFDVSYLRSDHPLTQRVHELADRLSLPRPEVGFMAATNAFAVGRTPDEAAVIIGTPLFQRLAPDELDAIIGHELGHIASGDMQRMQIAVGYQRLFDWIFRALGTFIGFVCGIAAQTARIASAAQLARAFSELAILIGQKTFNIGSDLSIKAFSRRREFFADAVGATLTSPDAMSRALQSIHRFKAPSLANESAYRMLMFRGGWEGHLFATHPTLEARLEALNSGTYVMHLETRMEATNPFGWVVNLWHEFGADIITALMILAAGALSFFLTLQLLRL